MLALLACSTTPPPSHSQIVRSELTNIMAVKGAPCGEVIEYSLNERMNYQVKCQTGHVYRIRIVPGGFLEANPHQAPRDNKP